MNETTTPQPPPPDGGPAFPVIIPGVTEVAGMTLRDYYAGQALAGVLAAASDAGFRVQPGETHAEAVARHDSAIAENAFGLADAMLRARGGVL